MASKNLDFTIKIQGSDVAVRNATDVRLAIKEINKQLKETEDEDAYRQLEEDLIRLKGELKIIQREQNKAVTEFVSTSEGVGAYQKLSAQLITARNRYKDLAAANKEATDEARELLDEVQALDARLKEIDGEVGQFQRNVGNYEGAFISAFEQIIPGFDLISGGLEKVRTTATLTGKAIQTAFLSFAAVSIVADAIGVVSDFTDEFVRLREEVKLTTETTGEELDILVAKTKATSDVFKTDFTDTLTATNALIQKFGTDTARAADLIGDSLQAAGDKGKFLGEVGEELKKLSGIGVDEESALAIIVQASNRDFNVDVLAEPLIALREQTQPAIEALEAAFGRERTEELFETFSESPIRAIKEISAEMRTLEPTSKEVGLLLADVFKSAGEDDITTARNLDLISESLDELIDKTDQTVQRQDELRQINEELARSQNNVARQFEAATGGLDVFVATLKRDGVRLLDEILTLFNLITPALKGIDSAVRQTGKNIGNFFRSTFISAQIFAKEIEKLNPFGRTSEQIDEEIKGLTKQRDEIRERGRSIGEAFSSGLAEGIAGQERRKAQAEARRADEEDRKLSEETFERQQFENEQRRKEEEKASEKRIEEKKKTTEKEIRAAIERNELLRGLSLRFVEESIGLIEDERTRLIETEKVKFEERIKELDRQNREFLRRVEEQEKEIVKVFGEESEEVRSFRLDTREQVLQFQAKTDELQTVERQKFRKELSEIDKRFDELDSKRRLEETRKKLEDIRTEEDLVRTELEGRRALGIITTAEFEEQSFESSRRELLEQISRIQSEVFKLEIKSELEEVPEEEVEALVNQQKRLNVELAKLEEERTAKVKEEQAKRLEALAEEFVKISDFTGQAVNIVGEFFEVSKQREINNIESRIDLREQNIASLREQVEQVDEVEKERLEAQIEREVRGVEQLERQKEQVEKKVAKQRKARSIIETLIGGAQAIIKTAANLGQPFAIPFQIFQAAQTAAQVAIIAAQPLAMGGGVGLETISGKPVALETVSGERIRQSPNVKTTPDGDNILVVAKRGEVVLNESQQRAIGGPGVFRAIGVPGFQEGGPIGAPIPAPSVVPAQTGQRESVEIIKALDAKTDAINGRIDRLRTFIVSDDIEDDRTERQFIKANFEL